MLPSIIRPILNPVKTWTWRILIIIGLSEVIALTSICCSLCGRTNAPGAHAAPHESRFGKVDLPDRGPSFQCVQNFEHNVIPSCHSAHKLISDQTIPNNIWLIDKCHCCIYHNTNYITSIQAVRTKQNLVFCCGDSIHILSTRYQHHSQNGNLSRSGFEFQSAFACEVAKIEQKQPNTRVGDYSKGH